MFKNPILSRVTDSGQKKEINKDTLILLSIPYNKNITYLYIESFSTKQKPGFFLPAPLMRITGLIFNPLQRYVQPSANSLAQFNLLNLNLLVFPHQVLVSLPVPAPDPVGPKTRTKREPVAPYQHTIKPSLLLYISDLQPFCIILIVL